MTLPTLSCQEYMTIVMSSFIGSGRSVNNLGHLVLFQILTCNLQITPSILGDTFRPLGPGGGTPLYKLYRYVLAYRVGFLRCFGTLKMSIHFAHFVLESDMVFRECINVFVVSIPNQYERKRNANSKRISIILFAL